jgi:hypothetical protein
MWWWVLLLRYPRTRNLCTGSGIIFIDHVDVKMIVRAHVHGSGTMWYWSHPSARWPRKDGLGDAKSLMLVWPTVFVFVTKQRLSWSPQWDPKWFGTVIRLLGSEGCCGKSVIREPISKLLVRLLLATLLLLREEFPWRSNSGDPLQSWGLPPGWE